MRAAEARVAATRDRIATLEDELASLVERERSERAALEDQLRDAWLLARRDPVQLLLEAERPDRVGRLLAYHERLARARVGALGRWQETRAELGERRGALEARAAELVAERDAVRARAGRLEEARRDRTRALASLEREIGAREEDREALLQRRERLAELLDRLAREAAQPSGERFLAARGRLPWPVDAPVLERFGSPRSGGRLRTDGVLLGAEPGTPVRAVAPGEIVFADWMRGFGLMVIVDHGGGFMSLYAQAESLLRAVGDRVEAGEPLATAGQSGGSSRAGVWFEIRRDGRPEDPGRWCGPRA
ncbi:MAG: peptidoglycan DD-metalloendopeptidase family protein [Pseudomonadales bacterium]|nr:peptidoglycan DD-metalloendopeptidase family protein [Pseudomonadales bacterium]